MPDIHIERADHRVHDMAARIHAVQMAAYAQEALLLGYERIDDFPPLQRTVEDIQQNDEHFTIAFLRNAVDGDAIVGAVGIELPDVASWSGEKLHSIHIASLVVMPKHQRQGIGRQLIAAVVAQHATQTVTVSTDVKNIPAITLYKQFGFAECQRRLMQSSNHTLELALLRRPIQPFQ